MNNVQFIKKFSLEERRDQAVRIKRRYPDRVPIIVNTGEGVPELDKQKYLVPRDLKSCEFMCVIRKRITMASTESLYMFFNNKLVESSAVLGKVYENNKSDDDFLYVNICVENTFG